MVIYAVRFAERPQAMLNLLDGEHYVFVVGNQNGDAPGDNIPARSSQRLIEQVGVTLIVDNYFINAIDIDGCWLADQEIVCSFGLHSAQHDQYRDWVTDATLINREQCISFPPQVALPLDKLHFYVINRTNKEIEYVNLFLYGRALR